MRVFYLTVLSAALFVSDVSARPTIDDSIVHISVTSQAYNEREPWLPADLRLSRGSGVVINGNQILTNAHVINKSTFIQVKKANDPKQYVAIVRAIAHDSDLAILEVVDINFFKKTIPLEIGDLPHIRDKVAVYGFPKGGDTLSVTEGVISRIEYQSSVHDDSSILVCQIDAAVNPGNSGGPVLKGDKIVGVAFQGLIDAQNTNYVISTPVIKRFLKDIEDGQYDGLPSAGINVQPIENADMREYYGLKTDQSGVLITHVMERSSARGQLQDGDVVMAIDGFTLDGEGNISLRDGLKVSADYIMHSKQKHDQAVFTVLRNNTTSKVRVTLSMTQSDEKLIPYSLHGNKPSYYVLGGLVFTKVTAFLLQLSSYYELQHIPWILMSDYFKKEPSDDLEELVALVKILPDEVNMGYTVRWPEVVVKVNGHKISSLKDMIATIEKNKGEYHIIEMQQADKIIMGKSKVDNRNLVILKKYGVPADRSEDMMSR